MFDKLPVEIIKSILEYVPVGSLTNVSRVDRKLHLLSRPLLWEVSSPSFFASISSDRSLTLNLTDLELVDLLNSSRLCPCVPPRSYCWNTWLGNCYPSTTASLNHASLNQQNRGSKRLGWNWPRDRCMTHYRSIIHKILYLKLWLEYYYNVPIFKD